MIFMDIMPSGNINDMTNDFANQTFPYLKMLCYATASILGLVAALRVYNLWNINGRRHIHIDAQVIAWIGAAMFLIIATAFVDTVLL
ncbi:MAG TPA: DUF4134 family protein [Arachidicoccus soli]|uniref:DUF4134 domain-containing protein n=1 Tax=Arachidicoccus soli TaxID=2341117 RepID=A0A386HU61_9BACT|nr:DUF4134 family protein [Arachidicoccus soli]AYD49041.1 DUF4134 domain-containing protein [Arachidicoccus soli]HEU0227927.1 DUF4134 family protein [Arachidicoccus soli]